MSIRKWALTVAAGVLALGASLTVASPAQAGSGHLIGGSGFEQRCFDNTYNVCLYYDTNYTQHAYFGSFATLSDLSGYTFLSGTGTGAGQAVKRNSNYMFCTIYTANACYSYSGTGYTGNYDWMPYNNLAQLTSYTRNNNQSLFFY
jgi:hypothetical protein